MKYLRFLWSDIPLKLFSLVLAFGVWHIVRADLVEKKEFLFDVVVHETSDELETEVTFPSSRQVSVMIEGPANEVQSLGGLKELIAQFRIEDDALALDQDYVPVEKDFEGLVFPALADLSRLTVRRMTPNRVVVELRRFSEKVLAVAEPAVNGATELENVTVSVVHYTPEATVRARRKVLASIHSLEPFIAEDEVRRLVANLGARTVDTFTGIKLSLPPEQESSLTLIAPTELRAALQ